MASQQPATGAAGVAGILAPRILNGVNVCSSFAVIDVDPATAAGQLQQFVDRGSKLTGVDIGEIRVSVVKTDCEHTVSGLLEVGMKLFDAIAWLQINEPDRPPLTLDTSMAVMDIPTAKQVADAVFYCYFFLLTQARYPAWGASEANGYVANFLRVVMKYTEDQRVYTTRLSSFNIAKFDPKWIRHIHFAGMSQESLTRFGLGVAGYRMFAPFKLYEVPATVPPNLRQAAQFARAVALAPPSWNVHPVTRAPSVLTSRGNLNKNLTNLILAVFSREQIAEMVQAKVLAVDPVRQVGQINYMTWSGDDDISGVEQVF